MGVIAMNWRRNATTDNRASSTMRDKHMKTRATVSTISIFLLIGATIGLLLGCGGAAPASQSSEDAIAPKAFQADSPPPKEVSAENVEPETEVVQVGYKVGMRSPEFGLSLLDGSRVTSVSLADESKPVFIYFHATW